MGQTPDDMLDGLTHTDKLTLNNGSESLADAGDVLYDGTRIRAKDAESEFDIGRRYMQQAWVSSAGTPHVVFSTAAFNGASFIFPGSDKVGTPTRIGMLCKVASGGNNADFRVYDTTNSQTICGIFNHTQGTLAIVDLGTISNIPASEAIWEAQGRRGATSATNAHVAGVIIEFE